MSHFQDVTKNRYGFYELRDKPDQISLEKYYSEKYYQENKGDYQKSYGEEEVNYLLNKLSQKYHVIKPFLANNKKPEFLDIGCGEGWALKFFAEHGFNLTGLDYSNFGCKIHNPEYADSIVLGDISKNLDAFIKEGKKFDLIWLDNVLEHVLDPLALLKICHDVASENSVLVIEVPNDFSPVQEKLIESGHIDRAFWVVVPDHISYFNNQGLQNICIDAGWQSEKIISDFPIDFNLFNPLTNYVKNREFGRSCHLVRIEVENLIHSISPEKAVNLYQALADIGLGRQISGFFTKVK